MVNAYIAQTGNMAGALHIGCISVGLLKMQPALFEKFKALMTDAMTVLVEVGTGGTVLGTQEQPAPEHEKAGHA